MGQIAKKATGNDNLPLVINAAKENNGEVVENDLEPDLDWRPLRGAGPHEAGGWGSRQ